MTKLFLKINLSWLFKYEFLQTQQKSDKENAKLLSDVNNKDKILFKLFYKLVELKITFSISWALAIAGHRRPIKFITFDNPEQS